jgi:hypothetical protein
MRRLTVVLAAAFAFGMPCQAADFTKGDIKVSQPWARATPGGARVGVGYLTITNTGKASDRLIGGTAAVAGTVEIHDMTMVDGVMRMRRVEGGLEIKPGETVSLKPGGHHMMFIDLKGGMKPGVQAKGTLVFEKAGTIEIVYDVAGIGAAGPDGNQGGGTSHHKH